MRPVRRFSYARPAFTRAMMSLKGAPLAMTRLDAAVNSEAVSAAQKSRNAASSAAAVRSCADTRRTARSASAMTKTAARIGAYLMWMWKIAVLAATVGAGTALAGVMAAQAPPALEPVNGRVTYFIAEGGPASG